MCLLQDDYWVSFDGWGPQHNELLRKEFLRPKNKKRELRTNMHRETVEVPRELIAWVQSKPDEIVSLRKSQPNLIHMRFDPRNNSWVLIGPEKVLKITKSLIRLHFDKRKLLMKSESKAREMEARLEVTKSHNECL